MKLIAGIVIFAGLPLVGWGMRDAPGFAAHPARLGYIILIVLLQVFVVIRFPEVGRGRGEGKKIVRRQRWAVLLLQILSLAIVMAAPYRDRRGIAVLDGPESLRYAGLAILALGFVVMNWAEAVLGRQFSVQVTVQEDHKLVMAGPYRHLRHPRYLGILLFNLGVSLVFRSWLALIIVAAMTPVLLWRVHDEEALLHQEFGEDWDTYARGTWRLIPFVH